MENTDSQEGTRQPALKQVKISTYGPAGKNREKFTRRYQKNPQLMVLNDIPWEVINHKTNTAMCKQTWISCDPLTHPIAY